MIHSINISHSRINSQYFRRWSKDEYYGSCKKGWIHNPFSEDDVSDWFEIILPLLARHIITVLQYFCVDVSFMSMEPSKKKQRHDSNPRPDISASTTENYRNGTSTSTTTSTTTFPLSSNSPKPNAAGDRVRSVLRDLRTSQTSKMALQAIKNLYGMLTSGEKKQINIQIAEAITQWNGCGAILMALKDWHSESHDFCCRSIRSLVLITANVPIAKQKVVELGGVRTLLKAAEKHPTDYFLRSNSVGLLHNLGMGVDDAIRREVASEECLDLVIQTMKQWPDDKYTQKRAIKYLLAIGRMNDEQATLTLQKKRVGLLFVNALDRFRYTNIEVKIIAKDALQWYAMS
jgi:hypothetical protein